MDSINDKLLIWAKQFETYHLPTWDELPEIEFYMDQVIEYISEYVAIFADTSDIKIITPAMINNYVKLGLIPPPNKKRYSKIHIANLLVITIIKQVTVISQIRDAMDIQMKASGGRGAYAVFCNELERAIKEIYHIVHNKCIKINDQVTVENMAVKSISLALSSKIIAMKITELTKNSNILEGDNNE